MKWLVLLIFGLGGLAILITGLVWGGKRYVLLKNGLHAQGTVKEQRIPVDPSRRRSGEDESTYTSSAVVEFQTKNNETVRILTSNGGSVSNPARGEEIGATVDVVYDPRDPYRAQGTSFSQFWLGPVAVMVIGLIMTLMGTGISYSMGRMDKEFGPEFEAKVASEMLRLDPKALRIKGTVKEIKRAGSAVVVVCTAKMFDGSQRTFESQPIETDSRLSETGQDVDVYVDPFDRNRYYVDAEEMIASSKKA